MTTTEIHRWRVALHRAIGIVAASSPHRGAVSFDPTTGVVSVAGKRAGSIEMAQDELGGWEVRCG